MASIVCLACGKSAKDPAEGLHSDDPEVRRKSVHALARAKDTSAVDELIALLRTDRDVPVRAAAAIALGDLRDRRATSTLVEIATGNDALEVRGSAVTALGNLRDPESIAGLIAVWRLDADKNDNGVIQAGARYTLRDLAKLSYLPLVAALRDEHWNVRAYSADTLALIGDKRARAAIASLQDDPDPRVRHEVSFALDRLDEQ